MKSSLLYHNKKNIEAAAAVSKAASDAAARLEVLHKVTKLDIIHENDYLCCGFFVINHTYGIFEDPRSLLFTGIKQIYNYGTSNYTLGSRQPLLVYQYSTNPMIELHFGNPGLFSFTPSTVAVTLPDEILIGTLTKEEKRAAFFGASNTIIRGFDFDGHVLFSTKSGIKTAEGEAVYNVVMKSHRIAKIRAKPGKSVLEFKKHEIRTDVRVLLLGAALWLECIEREKPKWRR